MKGMAQPPWDEYVAIPDVLTRRNNGRAFDGNIVQMGLKLFGWTVKWWACRRRTELAACRAHGKGLSKVFLDRMCQQQPQIVFQILMSFDECEKFRQWMAPLS